MTRAEHLTGCRKRALELLDAGETQQAIASMVSDLGKHPRQQFVLILNNV